MTLQTSASPSPLRLNRYFLKALNFSLNEGFERGSEPEGLEIVVPDLIVGATAFQNPKDEREWRIELDLSLSDSGKNDFPYKLTASTVGYFTVEASYPKERIESLAKIAGPAFLYGTARDMISAITNRSPFPPLILQSAMFSLEEPAEPKQLAAKPKRLGAKARTARKVTKKK